MTTTRANLLNATALIILPMWAYFTSETPSITALIPSFIGAILLLCTVGIKRENKNIAHIAVVLTLLALLGLIKPLLGAMSREDFIAVMRVSIMILTGVLALVTFIKSFIRNRKAK